MLIESADEGKQDLEIAAELRISNQKGSRWRKRFLQAGFAGLEKDTPRPGRTPSIPNQTVQRVIRMTTQEKPASSTHWSTRTMARNSTKSRGLKLAVLTLSL